MLLAHGLFFFRPWPVLNTITAVITNAVVDNGIIVDHGAIDIGIMNYGSIYIYYCCIVPEAISLPFSAGKSYSEETAAVVDAAVKTNVATPVARMINIYTAFIIPIARRP